jgi:hypothetical protein
MFAITDLTETYDEFVVSAKRGFRFFDQRRALLVQDEVQPKKESELWWFAHGAGGTVMTVSENGREAMLERNGKVCDAYLLSPADATFQAMDAQPLPKSPNPEIQQQNKGVKKLAIHWPEVGNVTIAVMMVPRYAFEPAVKPTVEVTPLSSWKLAADNLPRLKELTVDGKPIEGFSPSVFTYSIELPPEAKVAPGVGAKVSNASATVVQAKGVPGTAQITVKDQAGRTALYQVRFVSMPVPGATDKQHFKAKPVTAHGITITASQHDGNEPKNVLDGDLETRWSASGEKEWIAFDFGKPREVSAVGVAWFSGDRRSTSFQIETSTDGKKWQVVKKLNSGGKSTDIELYQLDQPVTARYLRLHCFGNTSNLWNSMTEVSFTPPIEK